eukprot:TRINITY_DN10625_c0_g1_i1.p1 TRINITY_DN10625_c0_g1~~TRINITY_DN10625_c0_g1_i1.p1  ORF type:complete len:839 (-),score=134.41 TRINITY_DN10625_c0_g1_i1:68-2584(-)
MEVMQVLNETMEEVCSMRKQVSEKPSAPTAALPEVRDHDQPEQLLWQPSVDPVHELQPRVGAQGCLGLVRPSQEKPLEKQPSVAQLAKQPSVAQLEKQPSVAQLGKQPSVAQLGKEPSVDDLTPVGARLAVSSMSRSSERLLPAPRSPREEACVPRSPREGILREKEFSADGHMELIACDNCGRRFNPASLEKHRNVCRSVFGGQSKRSPFESHQQRLRELRGNSTPPPQPPPRHTAEPDARRRHRTSMNVPVPKSSYALTRTIGTSSSSSSLMQFTGQTDETAGPTVKVIATSSRESPCSRSSDLVPCPHCKRSFRPAVVEKHAKVCQSVFPSHDNSQQRSVYDSRHHRLKGTPFEAFSKEDDLPAHDFEDSAQSASHPRAEKRISSTPPRTRSVSELRSGMPPPSVGRMNATKPRSGSPVYSPSMASLEGVLQEGATELVAGESQALLRRSVSEMLVSSHLPQAVSLPASDAPVLAQEIDAFNASSSSIDALSPVTCEAQVFQPFTSSVPPARMESPKFSRMQSPVPPPSPVQGDFRSLADRRGLLERARLGVKMGQRPEHALLAGSMSEAVLQQRKPDSRQPVLAPAHVGTPQAIEGQLSQHQAQHIPLSSRSNYRNIISSAQGTIGSHVSAGSRSPKLSIQARTDAEDPLSGSLRSLSGSLSGSLRNAYFPTNAAKSGQAVSPTACPSHAKLASPMHAQSHIRAQVPQRTPRSSQTQPHAPPPSPATVRRQQLATGLEGTAVISPRALARNAVQAVPSPRMSPQGVMATGQVSSPRLSSQSSCGFQAVQLAQAPVTGLLDSSFRPTSTHAGVVPRLDLGKVQQMQQQKHQQPYK